MNERGLRSKKVRVADAMLKEGVRRQIPAVPSRRAPSLTGAIRANGIAVFEKEPPNILWQACSNHLILNWFLRQEAHAACRKSVAFRPGNRFNAATAEMFDIPALQGPVNPSSSVVPLYQSL